MESAARCVLRCRGRRPEHLDRALTRPRHRPDGPHARRCCGAQADQRGARHDRRGHQHEWGEAMIYARVCASSVLSAGVLSVVYLNAAAQKPQSPPASFESLNVCERIPGESVAGAVSGHLLDVKPVNIKGFAPARCIYGIDVEKK